MAGLDWLNRAEFGEATAHLLRCCGCVRWAGAVALARPFDSVEALYRAAETEWASASREEILEAFSHHPRIGDRASLRDRFPSTHAWSASEQAEASLAEEKLLDDLAEGNREYEARFGHIFIVCASGKSAAEMLALLRARVANDPENELKIAALEQMKITRLRLEKLLREHDAVASA
jgi:2-oxo-4-hydroxy-4-carboxy-5-ureidoimidazoline decarboxylase